ncbi:prolipoprotein diacylglyceryl transferase [Chitinophagaceae bacterium MMS25-I14]
MYPDFRYVFHALFGIDAPEWIGIFKTFGFFVAMGFIAAAWTITKELQRKEKLGLLSPEIEEKKDKKVLVWPHQRVGEIVIVAAIGGLAGAKLFNAFETWDDFIQHPVENLLSRSGLTFYGGLIVATMALYYFARKHKINFIHLCDAAAPGLMLAYGVGRLGCHFAGDGDWGIFNSAYISDAAGNLHRSTTEAFNTLVQSNPGYFLRDVQNTSKVPHLSVPAPGWLPDWVVAMNYPHNINGEGMNLAHCAGEYCSVLPVGVFPTPLYEAITCIILFFVLWAMRKRIVKPLHMFGAYLILNGLERFFVEKIRVNYKYDWGFIHPTQAEIISACLMLTGLGILLFYKSKTKPPEPQPTPA